MRSWCAFDFQMRLAPTCAAVIACMIGSIVARAAPPQDTHTATPPDAAALLREQYATLKTRLEQSTLQAPLYLESTEGHHALRGDVYAVIDHPIATASSALTSPADWCDVLLLHPNVKFCRPVPRSEGAALSVAIGRKIEEPLSRVRRVDFEFRVAPPRTDYMAVELFAAKGPLGTSDYRIDLEAVGLDAERTFLHLRYSYRYGFWARLAMRMYLRGAVSDKIGFTTVGTADASTPKFIGGLRGIIERNSMRYYLAIDVYLAAFAAPAPARFDQSLERWFDASERYARQLHEMDRATYLAMKRREYARQRAAGAYREPSDPASCVDTPCP